MVCKTNFLNIDTTNKDGFIFQALLSLGSWVSSSINIFNVFTHLITLVYKEIEASTKIPVFT